MGLRSQLLLVALSTLLLPWAGCHYVREMEDALRQNQANALLAQSQLLTQILSQQIRLPTLTDSGPDQPVFYTPRRYQPVQLDGYDDDWQGHAQERLPYLEQTLQPAPTGGPQQPPIMLQKALFQDALYILLQVPQTPIHYHNPGFAFTYSDHIRVQTLRGKEKIQWVFFTSGPGQLQGYQWHANSNQLRPANGVSAWWQETRDGFSIELVLPQANLLDTLDLAVYQVPANSQPENASASPSASMDNLYEPMESTLYRGAQALRAVRVAATRLPHQPASQWLKPLPQLTADLAGQRTDQRDAVFISPRGWPLSEQKDVLDETLEMSQPSDTNSLMQAAIARLYRSLIELLTPTASQTPWPLSVTRLSSAQARIDPNLLAPASQLDQARAGWYQLQNNQQAMLLTTEPVWHDDQLQGYLLLSQTSDALISLTNHALRKVTHLTLAVLVLVIAVLVLFASSLSWRIRRLKRTAEKAISPDGKIHAFKTSSRPDEIGDLSRSFETLLQRVHGYTDYLETLNSKLAHELRTPLAIVKSSLELLQQNSGDPQYLKRAEEGAERLRLILSAMSEASRVEQTIQHSELRPFDLSALLFELSAAYGDTYPSHRYEYQASQTSTRVTGNPELIAQMVDKLVDNARSFAEPGSTIQIQLETRSHQHQLRILNQGPPLPPHLRGQIFDSLVSARAVKSKDAVPHLGLGLYIVRLIAQAHQGQVRADNLPNGDGVVFTVTLPA